MKNIILGILLVSFFSCNKETQKKIKASAGLEANTSVAKDNFDDFKKSDDESCEDEEELKKKLIPEKPKAFKLQGGDAGCDVEALEHK